MPDIKIYLSHKEYVALSRHDTPSKKVQRIVKEYLNNNKEEAWQ